MRESKAVLISTVASRAVFEAAREVGRKFPGVEVEVILPHEIEEEVISGEALREKLRAADVVFIDIRSGGRAQDEVYEALKEERNAVVTLLGGPKLFSLTRLGSFSMRKFLERGGESEFETPLERYKKVERITELIERMGKLFPIGALKHARNYVLLTRYWQYGGRDNIENMLLLALREYAGLRKALPRPAPPLPVPEFGISHPVLGRFRDLPAFLSTAGFNRRRPFIGILFFGGMHEEQALPAVRALREKLEGDFNLIPIYADALSCLEAMRKLLFADGKPLPDALISLRWFRLNGGPFGGDPDPTLELLRELDVPIFCPAPMYMREIGKWRSSPQGLSPIEIVTAVVWPELDGCIEPIPSCGIGDDALRGIEPIEDRIERIAGRIRKWIELRRKPNSEKRIAIIIYDYPPGEVNIGSAAYLDTFESLKVILRELGDAGYRVAEPPESFKELFEKRGIVNSGEWTRVEKTFRNSPSLGIRDYERILSGLPERARRDLIDNWGEPPGEIMTCGDGILIPGLELGNIFIGLQPSRGIHEDPQKAYHDKTLPPHHQYVAFYRWLEVVWGADAVVHLGTHGTVEFTKGKEVGMSRECFPDILMGNLPHLYIYHVVNTSEAAIAKRRSYAVMISHNSPPYTTSGLYEGYRELEELVHEWREAEVQDPRRAEILRRRIEEKARENNLGSDDPEVVLEELYEMKRSIIPRGLHVLGRRYSEEEILDFVTLLLRYDRGEVRSLHRILAEAGGMNYDLLLRNPSAEIEGKAGARILEEIEEKVREVVSLAFEDVEEAIRRAGVEGVLAEEARKALRFGLDAARRYANNEGELEGLLRGLSGRFVVPNLGGDVIRDPGVLPTGRNIYQFDPNLIPSEAACERGAEIAENTLRYYLAKHGRYPESVGVVLWGFETTKTRGETVGQILHYLGVRVRRKGGSWYPELEIVPLEELGRPRIDCLINICGFFRDMFPNVMALLNRAFEKVAELEEPLEMNFIRKHSLEALERLRADVKDERTARRLSHARLFGPSAGEYGTKVVPLIETSNWRGEEDLAEAHIRSMNHAYAENIHAERLDDLYRSLLAKVDLVSQVRDSHDYEITDLDHYYEFFGGLAKSVEHMKGKKPEMLISDTTKEAIKTEEVGRAISRGVRTRLLNPKWIEGMLEHDFHGAQKIADRVEYLLGLAATTGTVEDWIWEGVARRFVLDEEMRKRLSENNKFAFMEIARRLLEAAERGYWKATGEEIERIREIYAEEEGILEESI